MLTHLIILLDDTSVSYCHYVVTRQKRRLIGLDTLRRGIVWAMKENLNIQFVYPDYELPAEYQATIDMIDHTKIMPSAYCPEADVVVMDDWAAEVPDGATCILRCSRQELADHLPIVTGWLSHLTRLNVVLTDVAVFTDADVPAYQATLDALGDGLLQEFRSGHAVQLNLLTDRMMLTEMNNCNAGVTNLTLAPDGKFYLCPAFYYGEGYVSVGDLAHRPEVRNQQLLRLDHAPLCRQCDAYQCRRCIWMNGQLTLDANTPSHQQCVVAHVERRSARRLQQLLAEADIALDHTHEIKEVDYLDPFNIYNQWK